MTPLEYLARAPTCWSQETTPPPMSLLSICVLWKPGPLPGVQIFWAGPSSTAGL